MMNKKYILGALFVTPLLPLMYFQGKKVKKRVPKLPEATGTAGFCAGGNKRNLTVLCLGESTIAGVGVVTHQEGFAGTLATNLATNLGANISWKVYAKSGYSAKNTHEKMLPTITETKADLIVIGLGANDAFELNTPKTWKTHIRALIRGLKLKFDDTPIVFLNMPPIKNFPAFTALMQFSIGNLIEILGEELGKVVSEFENVYYYDKKITFEDWSVRLNVRAEPSEWFSDGVHPSKLTYQTWARDISAYICDHKDILNLKPQAL